MPAAKLTKGRRTAGDLIDAVVDNMRRNLEELKYTTLAPSRYTVYLSPDEHARLEGILPRLEAEAIQALTEALDRMNRPSFLRRGLRWLPAGALRRRQMQNADLHWHVEFLCDVDGDLANEGDLVVHSDLLLPAQPDLGVGERTRRITTIHRGPNTTAREQTVETASDKRDVVYARIVYEDNRGRHQHDITRDQTTIGRGGLTYPVDIRVTTSEDVSREHARIRRDARTGRFFLIDLSTLGTTVNGRHIPRGVEEHDGTKRENGAESPLPDRARIGLADTIFLDFERVR